MITKIKAKVYAAKLRKRLAALKAERPKQLQEYKDGMAKWRKDMKKWVSEHGAKRVDGLKVEKESRSWRNDIRFNTGEFFSGAPMPPVWPDDKQIREIQALLRHLAITGQQTVQVSTADVASYLGEPGEAFEE